MRDEFLYFFRTFTFTGILNVVPQSFLMTHILSHRSTLLPLFLMLYSLGGVVGLWWSRRTGCKHARQSLLSTKFGRGYAFLIALTMNLALFTLFKDGTWQSFLACLMMLAFILEATFNRLDHALTERLSETELGRHATRASLAQLLGICSAPVCFTLGYSNTHARWVVPAVCVLFTGMSYWSLSSFVGSSRHLAQDDSTVDLLREADPDNQRNTWVTHLQRVDLVYLLFVLSMYCAAFLFTSYGIFMLRDYYRMPDALMYGGWMIATLNVSSIVGAAGYGAIGNRMRQQRNPWMGGASAAALLLFTIVLFALRLNFHLYFVLMLASLAGIPYGCFLVMSRDYASKRARWTENHMLSLYNMSPDAASITAFLVSFVVTLSFGERHATAYTTALIVTVIAFLVIALVASFGIRLLNKQLADPVWEGELK